MPYVICYTYATTVLQLTETGVRSACFEVMGNVYATRAHTQEPCPNEKNSNFVIGFCMRRQLPKMPTDAFYFIFQMPMPISGGPAKRQWHLFLVPVTWRFFSKNIFYSTGDFGVQVVAFFVRYLFCLLKSYWDLKSRVFLKDAPLA